QGRPSASVVSGPGATMSVAVFTEAVQIRPSSGSLDANEPAGGAVAGLAGWTASAATPSRTASAFFSGLFGPEVGRVLGLGLRVVDPLRDDHQLGVVRLVVPDGADDLRCDPDRGAAAALDHVVPELELQLSRDDEVELLLGCVVMAVGTL